MLIKSLASVIDLVVFNLCSSSVDETFFAPQEGGSFVNIRLDKKAFLHSNISIASTTGGYLYTQELVNKLNRQCRSRSIHNKICLYGGNALGRVQPWLPHVQRTGCSLPLGV